MTSPAKDHAPTRAYYFKLKNMTSKIQSSSSPASLCAIMKRFGEQFPARLGKSGDQGCRDRQRDRCETNTCSTATCELPQGRRFRLPGSSQPGGSSRTARSRTPDDGAANSAARNVPALSTRRARAKSGKVAIGWAIASLPTGPRYPGTARRAFRSAGAYSLQPVDSRTPFSDRGVLLREHR
jgi:hypothetical protein